jgi:hypothetical protein
LGGKLGQAGLISIPVKFSNPITSETVLGNVLLDTGSDLTMVTKLLARKLNLTGKPFQLTLRSIGDTKKLVQSEKVSLSIDSLEKQFSKQFKNVLSVQEICSAVKAKDWSKYLSKLGLELHKPIGDRNIVMFIGTDQPDMHIQHQNVSKSEKHPFAIKYNIGWTCLGKTIDQAAATNPAVLLNKRDEICDLKGLIVFLERTRTHDSLRVDYTLHF